MGFQCCYWEIWCHIASWSFESGPLVFLILSGNYWIFSWFLVIWKFLMMCLMSFLSFLLLLFLGWTLLPFIWRNFLGINFFFNFFPPVLSLSLSFFSLKPLFWDCISWIDPDLFSPIFHLFFLLRGLLNFIITFCYRNFNFCYCHFNF